MRLARRVGLLEAPRDGRLPVWARALATDLALREGLEPGAVIDEAEAILIQAAQAGVLGSAEGLAAFLEVEAGTDPEALLAGADRLLGQR